MTEDNANAIRIERDREHRIRAAVSCPDERCGAERGHCCFYLIGERRPQFHSHVPRYNVAAELGVVPVIPSLMKKEK